MNDILDRLRRAFTSIGAWMGDHRRGLGWTGAIFGFVIIAPIVLLFMLPTILGWFAPTIDMSQDLYAANRPVAYMFIDADGNEIGHRGAIVGARLSVDQMPAYLPAAFIAMEDRRFYSHQGIDIRGLLRAMWLNIRAGHIVAGGSTITQQTAKIVFLTQDRTFARKFEELFDAAALEKSLSKKQILDLYLNRIYLGSGAYGVDGAAHVYFGKSATDVTLPEAAMLATLTRAPSVFSPRRDLAKAQKRAAHVLQAMVETGAITQAQADWARAHPAIVTDRSSINARNYFLDTAADIANNLVSVNGKPPSSDLIVHVTLKPKLQDAARKAIADTLNKSGKARHASEAALVMMKPDGAVVALLGGRDYEDSVFNRATMAHRQPGSAFKPFVYLAALEGGMSPLDTRTDGPVDINGWSPTNYGNEHFGTVTLATALTHSINTITASLAQEVGISTVVDAAKRCGITSPLEQNASIALGTSEVTPLELTTAYATFANGGIRVNPYFVTSITDGAGKVLYIRKPPPQKRAIAAHVDRDLVAMLHQVMTDGTGRGAALPGRQAGGKTGTTQDYHDAWFVGFTTDYVTGVWVGNDDSSPMKRVTGGSLPAHIWRAAMTAAEKGEPVKALDMSDLSAMVNVNDFYSSGIDSEAGGYTSGYPRQEQAPPPQSQSRDEGSFWDWLFGRDDSREPDRNDRRSEQRYDQHRDAPAVQPYQRDERYDNQPAYRDPRYGGNDRSRSYEQPRADSRRWQRVPPQSQPAQPAQQYQPAQPSQPAVNGTEGRSYGDWYQNRQNDPSPYTGPASPDGYNGDDGNNDGPN